MPDRASCDVLSERIHQLERRCDQKERKIEQILEFQNRLIGYTIAASGVITFVTNYLLTYAAKG